MGCCMSDVKYAVFVAWNKRGDRIKFGEGSDDWLSIKPEALRKELKGKSVRLLIENNVVVEMREEAKPAPLESKSLSRDDSIIRQVAAKCASEIVASYNDESEDVMMQSWETWADLIKEWITK